MNADFDRVFSATAYCQCPTVSTCTLSQKETSVQGACIIEWVFNSQLSRFEMVEMSLFIAACKSQVR